MTQLVNPPSSGSAQTEPRRETLAEAIERIRGRGQVVVVVGQCTSSGMELLPPEVGLLREREVHFAPSVQSAWSIVRDLHPDLVVMNLQAVNRSGFGRQLRQQLDEERCRGTRIAWCQ